MTGCAIGRHVEKSYAERGTERQEIADKDRTTVWWRTFYYSTKHDTNTLRTKVTLTWMTQIHLKLLG